MSEKFKVFISEFKKHFQKKHFLMMAAAVLFIAIAVSVPVYQVQAQGLVGNLIACMGDPISCGINAAIVGLSMAGSALLNFIFAVLVAVLNIGLELSAFLVMFGAWLIDAMLDPRLYVGDPATGTPGVLTSSTITVGWTTVRDMCNTFYVFFLLIIAFGTILRSSTFNAKNLLPKLIISLFLINFSAVIAKLVIDFGQVFMYGIMSWMGTFQSGGGSLTSIVDQFKNVINAPGLQANFDQVVRAAFALAYSVVLGLVYIMLACFLLIRLVVFVFLIILSPIAFLSITMPSLGKYTSEWWGELVKYSLFGPIFMFFVYLSATMANELVTNFTPLAVTGTALNPITGIISVMVPHSVALMMLLAVVPVTQRLGVAGANKIIGGTLGMGKIAMGTYAGIKLAGRLGKRVGGAVANRSEKVGGMVDRGKKGYAEMLGKVGLHGAKMRYSAGQEKEKEKNMKDVQLELVGDIDLKSADLDSMKKAANQPGARKEYGALVLKTAAAQGKLGEIPEGERKKYMVSANRYMGGKDMSELTNKNLQLATMTEGAKKKINEAGSGNYSSFNDETAEKIKAGKITAEEGVMRDKMADIIRDGKAHEVQGLDNKLDAKVWHEAQTPEQRKSSMDRGAKDQKNDLSKGYIKNTFQDDTAYSSASKEDQRKDMEYRINAVKLGKGLEESFTRGGKIAEKEIEEAFSKLNAKDIAKLDLKDLEKYAYKANSSQIKSLNRGGEYEAIHAIRSSKINKLSSEIKIGAIGGPKSIVDYNKVKKDFETTKSNLEREIKIGGDPARIDRLKKTIQGLEAKIKPFLELDKDIETIDDSLTGKSY